MWIWRRRGARSTRPSSSPSARSATGGSRACTPRSPRPGSSTTRTSTRDERAPRCDRRRRGGCAARGAREASGDRGRVARRVALSHRHRARGRVRPPLRRHPHVGARRRADAHRRRRRDAERGRGPALRRRPAVAGEAGAGLRRLRRDRRRRRPVRPRLGAVGRRDAAAGGGHRHLADRAVGGLRHLGRAPARVQLPRALEGRVGGRGLRVPDDAAEALHGADRGAGRAVSGGGRPAPVAAGAHPLQGRRAGSRAAGHAGVLPRRSVPRERHDRRGQAGSGPAGRAGGRPPGLPVRHRAAAGGVSRFASCAVGDRRFAALVEGESVRPLSGISELGAATPLELLASPPVTDETIPLADVMLRPVVPRPGKILCVGLNYRAHVEEGVYEVPDYPVLFPKFADALVGPGEPVLVPPESQAVDYEGEMALVIGRTVRRVSGDEALAAVAGYTVANDVTMRDYQYKTHQWLQGKSWANSTPLGPYLVTPDEVGDPHALDISLTLNGETMQSSNTSRFIFDIPTLIGTISEFIPLNPGDVILTGTPEGVGFRRDPKVLLRDGDSMAVEVKNVGRLESSVAAEVV